MERAFEWDRAVVWRKVVPATTGHRIERMMTDFDEHETWVYIYCACGPEAFTPEGFTDHIRRLVFEAVLP